MQKLPIFTLLLVCVLACNPTSKMTKPTLNTSTSPIDDKTKNLERHDGFFKFWWDAEEGKIWLLVDRFDTEFLYVNSLAAGVGSNDIGLDRGQLGRNRIVKFVRSGPKVLLLQPNYDFRAQSDNAAEKKSVEEAFAQSVIWGFKAEKVSGNKVLIDATDFLLRDAHKVKKALKETGQGDYSLDASRSAIYLPHTKNFPENSEFESMLTFTGEPEGSYVRDVVPSSDAITVRQHHSFVALPDDGYEPRVFDPRSGYYSIEYKDYATPISEPLVKRFITRHRLQKKDPAAKISEAVEPIIYYLDPGAPEPVRSALMEGASWWNEAFEAAGYRNAFQVKILPEDADPMDVRYNLIQWVHRSTRGWSYGSTVIDPRSGEIIKGHVSLGSLRVRQDFLIAQGVIAAYEEGTTADPKLEQMALARLRQLSAHEVGHTLGLAHNFAASTNGRASVMDYPHPYLLLKEDGSIDFSQAYDDKIGAWDKQAIRYGYEEFPNEPSEKEGLNAIIQSTIKNGLRYISDRDARADGGAHPYAHLWDNGEDAVDELKRLLELRDHALGRFGEKNIPEGLPYAELEEVLAPLYLSYRYQLEAVAKLIGGMEYNYAVRGDGQVITEAVSPLVQQKAIDALLLTITPEVLKLPPHILALIPPKPPGYSRGRESFKSKTGPTFDPLAIAESAAHRSLRFLLNRERAARMLQQQIQNPQQPGLPEMMSQLTEMSWKRNYQDAYDVALNQLVSKLILEHFMQLAADEKAAMQVRALAWQQTEQLERWIRQQLPAASNLHLLAHYNFALLQIERFRKEPYKPFQNEIPDLPDGSPIGMGCH